MIAENRIAVSRPNAWVLDFGNACRAAVGTRVLLHLIDNPKTFKVPYTPPYCHSVLPWQDQFLPVMDLAARLGAAPQESSLLAVACYQDPSDDKIHYGALLLTAAPVPVAVGDGQTCPLPEQPSGWQELALSCFDYQGTPVPILHLSRLFSGLP